MTFKFRLPLVVGLLGVIGLIMTSAGSLRAQVTVYMNSSGAVPIVGRSATFDSVSGGTSLTSYSEDGLEFSIPGAVAFESFTPAPAGFSGNFFYPSGGSGNPLTITTTDDATLYGVQFYLGSGWGQMAAGDLLPIAYQVNLGATVVGSGTFDALQTAQGYLLGFSDPSGFTTLTISNCDFDPCALSDEQAIAIDNVSADVTPFSTITPEPSTFMLFGSGLLAAAGMLKRKTLS